MSFLDRLISEPLQQFLERLLAFLPKLLTAAVILLLGLVAGWVAKLVARKILVLVNLDGYAERGGLSSLLNKGGVGEPPSRLLARIAGGVVVFIFFLVALSTLDLKALDHLVERGFDYLPNIIVAVIILVLGYMLGNFLGRTALIASVNAGMHFSRFVGCFVRYLIFALTTLVALEQLGIGKETVLLAFAILFSGIVLALAIAFGLGGRGIARDYLEKRLKERPPDDFQHL